MRTPLIVLGIWIVAAVLFLAGWAFGYRIARQKGRLLA